MTVRLKRPSGHTFDGLVIRTFLCSMSTEQACGHGQGKPPEQAVSKEEGPLNNVWHVLAHPWGPERTCGLPKHQAGYVRKLFQSGWNSFRIVELLPSSTERNQEYNAKEHKVTG